MSTTEPTINCTNLRKLLGINFYNYSFHRDITDDETQALEQFPNVKNPYIDTTSNNFKRKQLLEEMIETNMFSEMIFLEEPEPEPEPEPVGKRWQNDIDLLALHKMKTLIKNTNK